MANGHLHGQVGKGATGTYEPYDSPTVDIAPDSSGQYIVTYTYLTFFAGQNAYSCFVNGVEPLPGAGWIQGSCTWIPDEVVTHYDCINGTCTPKSTYNTPGIYTTIGACQLACGTGCGGVCVTTSDWAQIEGLASQLRSKECG